MLARLPRLPRLLGFAPIALGALLAACAADPAPQANGFNVELWFDAPSGGLVVGTSKEVLVQRIEAQYSRCSGAVTVCDPNAPEPIELLSAACEDAACVVDHASTREGALVLETTGMKEGSTTLRVKVRNVASGAVLEDAYPLVIQLPRSNDERRAPFDR